MKKMALIIIWTIFFPILSFSQGIYIKSGDLNVFDKTYFVLKNSSLEVDGKIHFEDNSSLHIISTGNDFFLQGDIFLQSLIVDGDYLFNSEITVDKDIHFNSGIVDIENNDLILNGRLINEREDSYIFSSSTGAIVVKENVNKLEEIAPGNLGLNMSLSNYSGELELRRTNYQELHDGNRSILRTYSFFPFVDIEEVAFRYFDHEQDNLDESKFSLWVLNNSLWSSVGSISHFSNLINIDKAEEVAKMTVFAFEEKNNRVFPSGFTPNGDGINDYFIISEIDDCPNCRLIVFNESGDILYDKHPYTNDWDGRTGNGVLRDGDDLLEDGTYYYIFYKDVDNRHDVHKGYIELKTK